jgi:hypothetical protein
MEEVLYPCTPETPQIGRQMSMTRIVELGAFVLEQLALAKKSSILIMPQMGFFVKFSIISRRSFGTPQLLYTIPLVFSNF